MIGHMVTTSGSLGEYEPSPVVYAVSAAGMGLGAYHGYKRNNGSVGWAVVWALLGGAFPIITTAVAIAEGFGKPKTGV